MIIFCVAPNNPITNPNNVKGMLTIESSTGATSDSLIKDSTGNAITVSGTYILVNLIDSIHIVFHSDNGIEPDTTFSYHGGTSGVPQTTSSICIFNTSGSKSIIMTLFKTDHLVFADTIHAFIYDKPVPLSGLTSSKGALVPAFDPSVFSYTITVPDTVNNITLTAVSSSPYATISIDGNATTSGTPSASISLQVGSGNIENVITTADDGTTKCHYTVTITKNANNDADLASLTVAPGVLSTTFSSSDTSYTVSLLNTTDSIVVTPTTINSQASVTISGSVVVSGTSSAAINLATNTTTIRRNCDSTRWRYEKYLLFNCQ